MKHKILIIDDELSIRAVLEAFLKDKYEIIPKNNGFEALAWLQQGNMADLIVADLQMPELDGFELVKNIKASNFFNKIPVIILSGNTSSQERIKCLKVGANDYVLKPFNPEELELRIENLLNRN